MFIVHTVAAGVIPILDYDRAEKIYEVLTVNSVV